LQETTPVEIWFEDEARIGEKNGLVRQWAKRGTKPRQPADQRYDNAYLFGAICPARGVGAAHALPHAHTGMLQLWSAAQFNRRPLAPGATDAAGRLHDIHASPF
jgi:hypothetical protein